MELSVTPAGSLRLWQASGESGDGDGNDFEPAMQADQWGAAASATSGVRSNVTLDSGRCSPNILRTFLPNVDLPSDRKNPAKRRGKRLNRSAASAIRINAFSYAVARLRTSLFSTFPAFYTSVFAALCL